MLTKRNKISQNFNFKNFKNPKRGFVITIEKKIQENFENVGGVAF